jgi:hypothetical protein
MVYRQDRRVKNILVEDGRDGLAGTAPLGKAINKNDPVFGNGRLEFVGAIYDTS